MSIDKSLRRKNSLARARNVLTRAERIKVLIDEERWQEGRSPLGLPKVRVLKVVIKKAKKKEEEKAAEGAAPGAAPAAAGDKKPAARRRQEAGRRWWRQEAGRRCRKEARRQEEVIHRFGTSSQDSVLIAGSGPLTSAA